MEAEKSWVCMDKCPRSRSEIVSCGEGQCVALTPLFLSERKEIKMNNLRMDPKRMEANDIRWLLNAWEIKEIESHYMIIANAHEWEEETSLGQRWLDEEGWFEANTTELNWKEWNQTMPSVSA